MKQNCAHTVLIKRGPWEPCIFLAGQKLEIREQRLCDVD